LTWSVLLTTACPLFVMFPAVATVPLSVRSVPAPSATLKVTPLLTLSVAPSSTVNWSASTLAVTVTVCGLRTLTVSLAEVGVCVAATHVAPSTDISHVAFAFQLPVAALRNFRLEAANPGVRLKSSTASPSSAPEASRSVQRITKVAPFAILSPVMVLLIAVRLAAAFPSSAPAAAAVLMGLVKSNALASV
jgi:hypothetical protein